jgi:hypothetical protein
MEEGRSSAKERFLSFFRLVLLGCATDDGIGGWECACPMTSQLVNMREIYLDDDSEPLTAQSIRPHNGIILKYVLCTTTYTIFSFDQQSRSTALGCADLSMQFA